MDNIMSTRSTISIINLDGTVTSAFCHWDGYLSHNGALLYQYYNSVDKIKKLVNNGAISSLSKEIEIPDGVEHSYDNRADGITIFYGRDRGEKEIESQRYSSFKDYVKNAELQGFDYVFHEEKNSWYLLNNVTNKLQKLRTLLKNDKELDIETVNFLNSEKKIKRNKP
jgi:hypothetical protein